jgi:hypothetical protein
MEWSVQSSSPLLPDIQQTTIQSAPALEIVGARCIPTGELDISGRKRVVIDVRPDPRLASILNEASQQMFGGAISATFGLLPYGQGNAITERVKNVLVGLSLVLDSSSVAVQRVSCMK